MSAPFTGRQQSTFRDGVGNRQDQPQVPPYTAVTGGVNTTISRAMSSTVVIDTTASSTVLLLDSSFKKGDVVRVINSVNATQTVNANTGGVGRVIGAALGAAATPAAGTTASFLCTSDTPALVASWTRF